MNLDPDHLGHLRLDQVDQIQRRRRVSRGFFDHHLIGNQLEFVVKGAGTYLLSRFFVDVVHRAFRLLQLQKVGGEGFFHGRLTTVLFPPSGEVEGLECGVDGLADMRGNRRRLPYLCYPLEEEAQRTRQIRFDRGGRQVVRADGRRRRSLRRKFVHQCDSRVQGG